MSINQMDEEHAYIQILFALALFPAIVHVNTELMMNIRMSKGKQAARMFVKRFTAHNSKIGVNYDKTLNRYVESKTR